MTDGAHLLQRAGAHGHPEAVEHALDGSGVRRCAAMARSAQRQHRRRGRRGSRRHAQARPRHAHAHAGAAVHGEPEAVVERRVEKPDVRAVDRKGDADAPHHLGFAAAPARGVRPASVLHCRVGALAAPQHQLFRRQHDHVLHSRQREGRAAVVAAGQTAAAAGAALAVVPKQCQALVLSLVS